MPDHADTEIYGYLGALEIIPARPELSSAELANLIWIANARLMEFLFQSNADWRRLFLAVWPRRDGLVCHARTHVAVPQGRVAGVRASHDPALIGDQLEASMLRWRETESPAYMEHLAQAFDRAEMLFPPEDAWYILDLAVGAGLRKAGIGRHFRDQAEADARKLGRSAIHLDMVADIPGSGFYERVGMQVAIETRLPGLDEQHGVGLHCHWAKPVA